jgi:hypothetical protein
LNEEAMEEEPVLPHAEAAIGTPLSPQVPCGRVVAIAAAVVSSSSMEALKGMKRSNQALIASS